VVCPCNMIFNHMLKDICGGQCDSVSFLIWCRLQTYPILQCVIVATCCLFSLTVLSMSALSCSESSTERAITYNEHSYISYAPRKISGEHNYYSCPFVCPAFVFRAITLLFVLGLRYCLVQMIVITRRHVVRKNPVATFKVKVTGQP